LRAHIIVDLGFGDAGKGLLTDFLARKLQAGLVVRYNGGAQAGHNVVTHDGRHHTFSQFGAGTFLSHVRTFLSRHVVIHPAALLVEGQALQSKGITDPFARLAISEQALVITPYHQALNRIREMARNDRRHGSCGVGVGETVDDALAHPESHIRANDLMHPEVLRAKTRDIRHRMWQQASSLLKDHKLDLSFLREYAIFERESVMDDWLDKSARIRQLNIVAEDALLARWLGETENVIFEGAQGVLLDADVGFHPYTTWSRCTSHNAQELLKDLAPGAYITRLGVLRAYTVRHGPGPLPTETGVLKPIIVEHNQQNDWQGDIRYGWFDAMLARYALDANEGVDALAVTHMDVLDRLPAWQYCEQYEDFAGFFRLSPTACAERTAFSARLSQIKPILTAVAPEERDVLSAIEMSLGQTINLISRGCLAQSVTEIAPM
jgi:adenylosuccinate synthase